MLEGLARAEVGDAQNVREGRVGERERGGVWHRSGHVGDAVVNHAVDNIAGIGVRGGARCLNASTLVDGHIDNDSALFHLGDHGAGNELGRGGSGDEYAADDEIGLPGGAGQVVAVGGKRVEAAGEDIVELAKAIQVHINESDLSAEAECYFGCVGADDAASDDADMGGGNAGDSAEKDAAAAAFVPNPELESVKIEAGGVRTELTNPTSWSA